MHKQYNNIKTFIQGISSDHLQGYLVKSSLMTFALKVGSTGLSFVVSILLARSLGTEGYGTYVYVLTIALILSVLSSFGQAPLLVRNVAAFRSKELWGKLRGMLRLSYASVFIVSILSITVAYFISLFFTDSISIQQNTIILALFLVPLLSFLNVFQATLRGLKHIILGQISEMLIRPVTLFFCIGYIYLFLNRNLSINLVLTLNIVSVTAALAVCVLILRFHLPHQISKPKPETDVSSWARSSSSVLFFNMTQAIVIHIDIIILGALSSQAETGIYSVAYRGFSLILFLMASVEIAVSPQIASLYAKKEMARLQKLLTFSARLSFSLTAVAIIFMIVISDFYLLAFGPEFIKGKMALIILCAGALINSFFGPSGQLALMTGNETAVSKLGGGTAALQIVLCVLLIPTFGGTGAAIAKIIAILFWNILIVSYVYRKNGLSPLVIRI